MLLTSDWLTPKLPLPGGVEPYLGKPPFHFWLTALSYESFGVDEWSSRLPSFLAGLLILWIVYSLSDTKDRLTSVVITLSSGLFFFASGASTTDMTLAAFVTVAVYFAYRWSSERAGHMALLASFFCACAFLTKGPVSLILVFLPFFINAFFGSSFKIWRGFPWISSLSIFLLIVAPWFLLSEQANPGFLRYFIWNENLARYLISDYGDLYGSGHVHPRGTSWLMLALGFLPWTIVLAFSLIKNRPKLDSKQKFLLSWAIATPLFFTFARQLHALYLLPAIPPLALLSAQMITQDLSRVVNAKFWFLVWMIVAAIGLSLSFDLLALLLALVVCFIGISLVIKTDSRFNFGSRVLITYIVVILTFSSYINQRRSAEDALKMAQERDSGISKIGVSTKNSFSHYWVASASELKTPLRISYVSADNAASLPYYLFKGKDWRKAPKNVLEGFTLLVSTGEWHVFKRV